MTKMLYGSLWLWVDVEQVDERGKCVEERRGKVWPAAASSFDSAMVQLL